MMSLLSLLLVLLLQLPTTQPLSQTSLESNCGVVSLRVIESIDDTNSATGTTSTDRTRILCGTKRGDLLQYSWNHEWAKSTKTDELDGNFFPFQQKWTIAGVDSKSFPIYSLATGTNTDRTDPSSTQVFCGGGDRFVSVFSLPVDINETTKGTESKKHNQENRGSVLAWTVDQRLGPHTGWVKAVLYDDETNRLHSIGCNCIETWSLEESYDSSDQVSTTTPETTMMNKKKKQIAPIWKHEKKRSVESSVSDGSTLSSDLLCLCDSTNSDCFYCGGVDGRLHVWSSNPDVLDPILSTKAHVGRVNRLLLDNQHGVLFSFGNDGQIQCRFIRADGVMNPEPSATITIRDQDTAQGPLRLTAAAFIPSDNRIAPEQGTAQLVVGTACGLLVFIEVEYGEQGTVMGLSENGRRYRQKLSGNPVVNALEAFSSMDLSKNESLEMPVVVILVGHSKGLEQVVVVV